MSAPVEAPPVQRGDVVYELELEGSLDDFLAVVRLRPGHLIKYRNRRLTIVTPSLWHERSACRFSSLVQVIGFELDIAYHATGSTLYRRPGHDHGIMADKAYYIANEAAVRPLKRGDEIDLATLPPPDLAIEVVVWHEVEQALEIYGEMGVPEVWGYRARHGTLEFLHRDDAGQYTAREASRAFPFLKPADALPWIESDVEEPDNHWERRLRAWVRETLAPRPGREER